MITIDPALKKVAPHLTLGIVTARVEVSEHDDVLWKEIDAYCIALVKKQAMDTLVQQSPIATLRNAYKALGKDPLRYRSSADALTRRIFQGKGLYHINTIVDCNNLLSLETLHSCGCYDMERLTSPVSFTIGKTGQCYKGIGKDMIQIGDLPVFSDAKGPFGSPTSDSERAMITLETKQVMLVIIAFDGDKKLPDYLERASSLLADYAFATDIETSISA